MCDGLTRSIRRRYDRIAPLYDILQGPMGNVLAGWRGELLGQARGRVLEVGVGTGASLSCYPEGVQLTGIDFSARMIGKARHMTRSGLRGVTLAVMDAEEMSFQNDSFDTVVSMCVFCSVPHPDRGLREIRRVCRPGGRLLMLEHVRSEGPIAGPLMDLLNPLPFHLYGASINRRTVETLRGAGFVDILMRDIWRDIMKMIVAENRK
jgi:ubiquinone/menaquinone biosynthesis C-methylase UbiE